MSDELVTKESMLLPSRVAPEYITNSNSSNIETESAAEGNGTPSFGQISSSRRYRQLQAAQQITDTASTSLFFATTANNVADPEPPIFSLAAEARLEAFAVMTEAAEIPAPILTAPGINIAEERASREWRIDDVIQREFLIP